MIPIPGEILEHFGIRRRNRPDILDPTRPWWRVYEGRPWPPLRRGSLDVHIIDSEKAVSEWTLRSRFGQSTAKGASSESEVFAAFDRALPAPHPGFRAGQVWARLGSGGQVQTVLVTETPLSKGHILQPRWSRHGGKSPWFLMADPGAPHLAPWAPAEEPVADPEAG